MSERCCWVVVMFVIASYIVASTDAFVTAANSTRLAFRHCPGADSLGADYRDALPVGARHQRP